jgi:hypothetical protein
MECNGLKQSCIDPCLSMVSKSLHCVTLTISFSRSAMTMTLVILRDHDQESGVC